MIQHYYKADQVIYEDTDIAKKSHMITIKKWFGITIFRKEELYNNRLCDALPEKTKGVGFKTKSK